MFYSSLICLIIAVIAAVFGFWEVIPSVQGIAMWIFWIFAALFVIFLIIGLTKKKSS